MSYVTGTTSGYHEFLELIKDFLSNQGHAWGKTFTGVGTGVISNYIGTATSVTEMFTITATNSTTFSVVGSVSGSMGNATVGTPFTSSKINFTISSGGTAFVSGDTFTLQTTPAWECLRWTGCLSSGRLITSGFTNHLYAFDNETGQYAYTTVTNSYLGTELFVPDYVYKFTINIAVNIDPTPENISLQYSDNGSNWTTLESWTGLTWTSSYQVKTFTVSAPESHKYWRVIFTSIKSGQTQIQVSLIKFFNSLVHEWSLETRFEAIFKAPGLDGTKSIYIGGYAAENITLGKYNFAFNGFRYFDDNKSVLAQQTKSNISCFQSSTQSFTYHMVANGQRVIIVSTPNGSWQPVYLGFGLPYELPTIHEYPCIVGATAGTDDVLLPETSALHRAFFSPYANLQAFYPDNFWRVHQNRTLNAGSSDGATVGNTGKSYPWAIKDDGTFPAFTRDQIDGGFPLVPGMLFYSATPYKHIWGEYDGVYYTPGFNNSAGTLISFNGFDHLVVKNITRTNTYDYAAIRLD